MTATRTKENSDNINFFKTPLRTPLRTLIHGTLSSVRLTDLSSYSSKKLSKFSSNSDIYNIGNNNKTPLRTPLTTLKSQVTTLSSSRRALASINHNTPFNLNDFFLSSSDSFITSSTLMKDEQQSTSNTAQQMDDDENELIDPDDQDLPHNCNNEEDTFDDLIPEYERIERILPLFRDVNIINYNVYHENSIRNLSSPTLLASRERIFDDDNDNNRVADSNFDIGLLDVN
ncbi:unnamed protein product [Didymodactylos carnosus]|uniref:Uncharacterized protein n=1 Tax=Didymodactylos carnosus TaxID=1234261 RepID=A0A813PWD5_9BILA|nr:unnamed protein product [Didymodactylos carnosus]CAF3537518.1 unnamed protein product [Didymodactylos carnosus]